MARHKRVNFPIGDVASKVNIFGQIFCTYKSFKIKSVFLSFGKPFFGHLFAYPS